MFKARISLHIFKKQAIGDVERDDLALLGDRAVKAEPTELTCSRERETGSERQQF